MSKSKLNMSKNILFYADFGCDTGFAKVSKELVDHLSKDNKIKITIFAINDYAPKPYQYKDNVQVIPAIYAKKETMRRTPNLLADSDIGDVYCRVGFLQLLFQNNFDLLFCLQDVEIINQIAKDLVIVKNEKRKQNKPNFKSLIYFPIDSVPRKSDLSVINFFDEVVTYTEYGKQVLTSYFTKQKASKIKVIPHGINTSEFYPFTPEKKLKVKEKYFGSRDVFVIGSVNRNSPRKDIASLVVGFSKFKQNHQPNAILYLHCNPNDPAGINVEILCERLQLQYGVDVITPKDYNENKGYEVQVLNEIYNSFDVFMTTTTSEGWGLSITEAMATKTLVVCPKHTSLTEITDDGKNSLNFIFNQEMVFVNDFEKVRYITNPNEVCTLMQVVYNLKNEPEDFQEAIRQIIQRAYDKITATTWSAVSKEFKSLVDKLLK